MILNKWNKNVKLNQIYKCGNPNSKIIQGLFRARTIEVDCTHNKIIRQVGQQLPRDVGIKKNKQTRIG